MKKRRSHNKKLFRYVSFLLILSLLCGCGKKEESGSNKEKATPTEASDSGSGGSSSDDGGSPDVAAPVGADDVAEDVAETGGSSTTEAAEGAVAAADNNNGGDDDGGDDADPTPTPKPADNNNNKPTPTPKAAHVHSYKVTNSAPGSDCRHSGVDTYTCSCGDSYTQDNGKYGDHVWVTETSYTTETIHHDAVYKTETGYVCNCGIFWSSQDAVNDHYANSSCSGYHSTTKQTVISEAYDEEIQTPYTRTYCSVCGTE